MGEIESIRLVTPRRRHMRCWFCGGIASVKYDATLFDGRVVPCCNRCAFEHYVLSDEANWRSDAENHVRYR